MNAVKHRIALALEKQKGRQKVKKEAKSIVKTTSVDLGN